MTFIDQYGKDPGDSKRLTAIAARLNGDESYEEKAEREIKGDPAPQKQPPKSLQPRGPVAEGSEYELTNEDYMTLVNEPCFFCGDNTYNYMTQLDDTRKMVRQNMVSECAHCRRIRGNSSLSQYKAQAEKESDLNRVVRTDVKPNRKLGE